MSQRHHPHHARSQSSFPRSSRIDALDRRIFEIYVEMARLRAAETALSHKWHLWYQQHMQLDQEKPWVFAQGVVTAFGGPRLLPTAQNWHVRHHQHQRAYYRLQQEGIHIQSRLVACEQELSLIDLEIDLLISY